MSISLTTVNNTFKTGSLFIYSIVQDTSTQLLLNVAVTLVISTLKLRWCSKSRPQTVQRLIISNQYQIAATNNDLGLRIYPRIAADRLASQHHRPDRDYHHKPFDATNPPGQLRCPRVAAGTITTPHRAS